MGYQVVLRWFGRVLTVLLCGAVSPLPSAADLSIDVSPLRITLDARPGDTAIGSITIQNTGSEAVRLQATIEDWDLTEKGVPLFRPAGTGTRSLSPWIQWAPGDFLLDPEEREHIRVQIKVPEGVREGGYRGSLILESIPLDRADPQERQVQIRGRVACMIYTTVGNPPRKAEIEDLRTIHRNNQAFLQLKIRNSGEDHFRLAGEVDLLASSNNTVVNIELPDVPVLPQSSRTLEIELPREQLAEDFIARVTIDVPPIGRLIGECPVEPPHAQLLEE